jgi:hypothetical protein
LCPSTRLEEACRHWWDSNGYAFCLLATCAAGYAGLLQLVYLLLAGPTCWFAVNTWWRLYISAARYVHILCFWRLFVDFFKLAGFAIFVQGACSLFGYIRLFKGACSLCSLICTCLYILTCWFPALFHFWSIQLLTFYPKKKIMADLCC